MGTLFKTKQEKEQEMILLINRTVTLMQKQIQMLEAQKKVDGIINGAGRTLLRQSGTEPVVRVMVEAETTELCEKYAAMIADVIKERGHCID